MSKITLGKALLTATSAWSGVGSFLFDWNDTHIYNPTWPAHAKFHNAQTMSLGAALAAGGLWTLWGTGTWDTRALRTTTAVASAYWITQISAVAYPGTALFDHDRKPRDTPGNARTTDDNPQQPCGNPPRLCGPQPAMSAVALAINTLAYTLERRRLTKKQPTR